jgi:hypothetical protein
MERAEDVTDKIVASLQQLIASTKAANLPFAAQLLQTALLDILMTKHGIAAEDVEALRHALERRGGDAAEVLDFDQLRLKRQGGTNRRR